MTPPNPESTHTRILNAILLLLRTSAEVLKAMGLVWVPQKAEPQAEDVCSISLLGYWGEEKGSKAGNKKEPVQGCMIKLAIAKFN